MKQWSLDARSEGQSDYSLGGVGVMMKKGTWRDSLGARSWRHPDRRRQGCVMGMVGAKSLLGGGGAPLVLPLRTSARFTRNGSFTPPRRTWVMGAN